MTYQVREDINRLVAIFDVPPSAIAKQATELAGDAQAYRLAGALSATILSIAERHTTCRYKNDGCRICIAIRQGLRAIAADQQLRDTRHG